MRIEPSVSITKPGETIAVNISIQPSDAIRGAQCDVIFNKDVLRAKEVVNGHMFEYWANDIIENFTKIDNENGSIRNIVAFSANATNESGILAIIYFEAIQDGISYINITNAIITEEGNVTEIEIINGSIIVDNTSPVITLIEFPSPVIHVRNVYFEWNATDDTSSNIIFSYMLEGYDTWSNWSNESMKAYNNLPAGSYTFKIKAKDDAGNIGHLNYSFEITDVSPPEITNVVANPDEQYVDGYVNISCIITDDFGVDFAKVRISDGVVYNITMDNVGNIYFYNTTYSPGLYNFSIFAKDVNGNVNTSATYSFEIIDDVPPVITSVIYTPLQNKGREVNISCIVEDNVGVADVFLNVTYPNGNHINLSMNNTGNVYFCNRTYSYAGNYSFYIYAIDASGNGNKSGLYQFRINSPPYVKNPVPENGSIDVSINPTLSIFVNDTDGDMLTVSFYNGNSEIGNVTVASGNTASITWSHLQHSTTYQWYVIVSDGVATITSPVWSFTTTAIKYTLTVAINPVGAGNVSPSGGIYDEGTVVTLTAIANEGYVFDHWSGDATGSQTTINITIDGNKSIVANFEKFGYTLTVSVEPSDAGYVSPAGGVYDEGTVVKLTAHANAGYKFDHWSNGDTNNSTTIIMDSDKHIVAYFSSVIPIVSIGFTPTHPSPGVIVHFNSYTNGAIVNYTWDFGDGNISYEKNPIHAYAREGNYTVKLSITDDAGNKNETVKQIGIYLPDFIVENISYTPKDAKKGDKIYVEVKIKNVGGYAENVNCSIFLNNELIDFSIFNISYNEEKEIGFYVDIDEENEIKIVVDEKNEKEEKNEGNNEGIIFIKAASAGGLNYLYFLIPVIIAFVTLVTYFSIFRKKEILIERGEAEEKCIVCLGRFKEGAKIVKCKCGATFHKSCATRIKECPNCGEKL